MKKTFSILLLFLLYTTTYAQINFEEKIVIGNENATNNPVSVYAADIDGDGDMDIVSASSDDSKVAWYENTDGQGNYSTQKLISVEAMGASSVFAIDIDGDLDMDILSTSFTDNKIAWYENLDGLGTFGTQQVITTNATNAQSVFAADIDGDGDMDVISASGNIDEGKIAWYENMDGLGNFGTQNIINSNSMGVYSVYAADIDNDGDMDVLSAATLSTELVWYENIDSQGQFGLKQNVGFGAHKSVKVADIDNDGNKDVISISSNGGNSTIVWYKNIDGLGNFGGKQTISLAQLDAYAVFVSDIDNDGDLDIISGLYSNQGPSIEWYENLDGEGNFGSANQVNTTSGFTSSIFVADIDNNGSADIISASEDRIGFNKNLDGNGNFGLHQYFTYNVDIPRAAYAADIDGDGDLDILSASYSDGEIAWYSNVDGHGNFSIQKTISQKNYGADAVVAKDIDGDGDRDVIFASDFHVAWQENLDGNGTFGERKIITDRISSTFYDVAAEDIDGDGDMDVVTVAFIGGRLSWFENLDGQGNFGVEQNINNEPPFAPEHIDVGDINNDGKLDIISASLANGEANWHENLGGGNFAPPHLITSSYNNNIDFVHAADLDGDNDLDVIVTIRNEDKIVWFENTDGQGNFGPENIITSSVNLPFALYAADIDNDGDLDVISGSIYDNKVAWYENVDGFGNFGTQNIISADAGGANFVIAKDIDADGDIDIVASLSSANEIRWFKNSLILGVNESATLNFSIYPNPSQNILNITIQKTIEKVEVYNSLGQLVKNVGTLDGENNSINITKLATGTYFVKIKTTDGEIGVRRFLKV